jgi:hypothetical protein
MAPPTYHRKTTENLRMNEFVSPFTFSHFERELAFLQVPRDTDITVGTARMFVRPFTGGRLDDYLSVNFRTEHFDVPTYLREGCLWMSAVPMEICSMHVPIQQAGNAETVAIGGLGLGYVALRIASLDEEKIIDVYEIDNDCIAIFNQLYADHPNFHQLRIIEGDVRKTLVGKRYDFVFMDIYRGIGESEIPQDIIDFHYNNNITEFRWWGQELILLCASEESEDFDMGMADDLRDANILTYNDAQFFKQFGQTEESKMRLPMRDGDFAMECLTAHLEAQMGTLQEDVA